MQFLIIGNPENRRVQLFAQASIESETGIPKVISYLDLLQHKTCLKDHIHSETVLRIESPGENFEVEKEILALGAQADDYSNHPAISSAQALLLPYNHGQIRFLRQWYLGYKKLLGLVNDTITTQPPKAIMNSPDAIALMFDKITCQHLLSAYGVAVPKVLPQMDRYDTLKNFMLNTRWNRVFIKPAHSSSASGVIAYRINGQKEEAITSIEMVKEKGELKFYNSLKVRSYTSTKEIQSIIDFIISEKAIIEEWIPKAALQGHIFDVRVVVIGGKALFVLPRLSKSPLTNLHLGNKRGEAAWVKNKVGLNKYEELLSLAEKAVRCICGAFYAGVDIAIPIGLGQPKVLEVNAFGDLLPNLYSDGKDTYHTEISCLINKLKEAY